jgi:hypothetical protein
MNCIMVIPILLGFIFPFNVIIIIIIIVYLFHFLLITTQCNIALTPAIFHLPTYFSCTSSNLSSPCCTCFAYQLEKIKTDHLKKKKK